MTQPDRSSHTRQTAVILAATALLYFGGAYVLAPLLWIAYAKIHPALENIPNITYTGDDHPGDPINVALVGDESDMQAALKAAGWYQADALGIRADVRIAEDTVLKRPYDTAPVSTLLYLGRKQDLAFEQPVGDDPRQRHHVRFWKSDQLDASGRPLYVGSATYDRKVGLSHTTGEITHHIAADVDAERDHLLKCLADAGELTAESDVPDFHPVREGRNGGGDLWKTDGRLRVGVLKAVK